MTLRRLLLALLLAIPAALLAAAWFGPQHLDWEAQRGRIAAIAAGRLGRPVELGGKLRVTLLPQPMVEAADVLVGAPDGEGLGIRARALHLRLGLLPLLAGRLEPRDLALVGADIRLPWPPAGIGTLRPAPWLTGFDARIERSRITIGEVVLDHVAARLVAPGPLDAVRAEGSFTWRGAPVRFEAIIGRPGFDGVATLDVVLGFANASATARGVLVAEGGFEGRVEVAGGDLSALIAAPAGPFRGNGRLTVTAELAAADDLALDLGGVTGRAAATFRFAPDVRLDMAIALSRLDLDAWIAALRGAQPPPLPVGLDLSAELAAFRGQTLRRLRGGVFREGERITLTDITALLPGETEITASGATAGSGNDQRLELALRFAAANLRATIAAYGVPLDRIDPARLREAEGRARIVLEPGQLNIAELAARLDGAQLSGAGVYRFGARPALGLGLTFDRLDLDGLLAAAPDWPALARTAPDFDANLRIAAETATWRGTTAERAAIDAVVEAGRLGLRRASGRIGGADITLAGSLAFGAMPRFSDIGLDIVGGPATGLARLLAPLVELPEGLAGLPLRLRLAGGGPADALALTAEAELGELRLEGQATTNLPQWRIGGSLTLRHPGAPRLATLLGAEQPPAWLGEGSFSLVAAFAAAPDAIAAENFDVVAGGLRSRGQLVLALGGPRPRLTGRIAADRLPLPDLPHGNDPLPFAALSRLDAEVALEAAELISAGLPPLRDVAAGLTLADGRLAIAGLRAQLGGGTLEGNLTLDGAAQPPALSGALGLAGATLTGPLFGTPFDLASGEIEAQGRFSATGHAAAALLGSLAGEGRFAVSDGVLSGLALGAAASAAALENGAAAEDGVRAALAEGVTAIDRLEGGWRATAGVVALEGIRIAGEGGTTGGIEGSIDLPRGSLDLRFTLQPGPAEAPAIALRVSGPAETPRRQPEIAPWALWRAERR